MDRDRESEVILVSARGLKLRPWGFRIAALASSLLLGLAAGELILRAAEKRALASRIDYGQLVGDRDLGPGGLLEPNIDAQVVGADGRAVRWGTNSSGFRNQEETSLEPSPGTLRVLSLGDSFTAGFRIDQEETFSRLLELQLGERCGHAEVLVAMTEEPATGLAYLVEHGHLFHPQLVLLGITLGNDLAQTYLALDPRGEFALHRDADGLTVSRIHPEDPVGFRHGLESLLVPPDCLETRGALQEAGWWIGFLRSRSRLLQSVAPRRRAILSWYKEYRSPRLVDPMHGLGFFLKDPPEIVDEAYRRLFQVLEACDSFLAERGVRLVVAIFPQRFQVQPQDWQLAVSEYGLAEGCFDLEAPNARIIRFCRTRSIAVIDPTPEMAVQHRATGLDLYQGRGDMHWNAQGHRAFADAAGTALIPLLADADECPRTEDGPLSRSAGGSIATQRVSVTGGP
jgi:hypothetical protein